MMADMGKSEAVERLCRLLYHLLQRMRTHQKTLVDMNNKNSEFWCDPVPNLMQELEAADLSIRVFEIQKAATIEKEVKARAKRRAEPGAKARREIGARSLERVRVAALQALGRETNPTGRPTLTRDKVAEMICVKHPNMRFDRTRQHLIALGWWKRRRD